MELLGYEKNKIVNLQGDSFDCIICFKVAREPQECQSCGGVFCQICLTNLSINVGLDECLKCGNQNFSPLNETLKQIYDNLDLKCQCGDQFKMKTFTQHTQFCSSNMSNCNNFSQCGQKQSVSFKIEGVCSQACFILARVKSFNNNWPQIYKQLGHILYDLRNKPLVVEEYQNIQQHPQIQQQISIKVPSQQANNQTLVFSRSLKASTIQVPIDGISAYLDEKDYVFRTALCTPPFTSGINYWEIVMDQRTENELKIGVICNDKINMDSAFCDYQDGFAYYTLGQLRNGSNSRGDAYGTKFKNTGTCGICLDMNKGTLQFSYNGVGYGVAFQSDKLRSGNVFPAVAFLHHAGCSIKSGMPVPKYFN